MAIFTSKGGTVINVMMVGGLPDIACGKAVSLELREEKLRITERLGKKKSYLLSYDQITNVQTSFEVQTTEKDKNVIGRAVVGGLLFGGAGAVIGGMSGIGKKTKTSRNHYLIINCISKSGNDSEISFQTVDATVDLPKFIDNLKERSGISD